MTTLLRSASRGVLPLLALSLALVVGTAGAANVIIVNNNAPGVGFNDITPRAPVGGNSGVTLGQQRLNVFQAAANVWGSLLPSAVTIEVRAQFANQTCTATSATLGSTSSGSIHRDFTGADYPGTWYSQSLANKLFGADLNVPVSDMNTTFNLALDAGLATCLGGQTWYYGLDGLEGTNVELLPVAIHEIGHGLNFATSTSGTSGNYNSGFPNVYDRFLLDKVTGKVWSDATETPAQRAASAISNDLVWNGASAFNMAQSYLSHRPRLVVNSPAVIAGIYQVGTASFGPALTLAGLTGNLVLEDDGTAPDINDGCEALVNAGAIAGNIAVVNRGTCTFVAKALAAQAAGATAVIVVNNAAGAAPALGGTDPSVTIPVIAVSQADGNLIKAQIGGGVNVTMNLDPVLLAGADNNGKPKMYSPNPFVSGSSVSHWDVSMTPNALMEPNINGDLHNSVDLALYLMQDIGWFPQPTATTLARFTAEGRGDGILLRWQFTDPAGVGSITIERSVAADGPFSPVTTELGQDGAQSTAFDASAEPNQMYFYRLSLTDRSGAPVVEGMVSAQRAGTFAGRMFLGAVTPNPASQGASVTFRLGQPSYVHLTVSDASGRKIRTLREGMMLVGEYTQTWDGRADHSGAVAPGVYFITLGTSEGRMTQRVAVVH